MTRRATQQKHYFEIFNLFGLAALILVVVVMRDDLTATTITVLTTTYFLANIVYLVLRHQLSVERVAEIGIIALLSQILLVTYLI